MGVRDDRSTGYREVNKTIRIGSALVVVGGTIAAAPAVALELGQLTVHSTLGQPLRASIAYAIAPNETVSNTCVTVQRVQGGNTPFINGGTVSVADGLITVTGNAILNEPVVSVRLSVRCPYTPRLMRDFTMFVDSPALNVAPVDTNVPERVASSPVAITPPVSRRPVVSREPIAANSEYLVQPGDSLSRIAQRIEDMPGGISGKVDAIFAANPDAFINNDPNRIMAGSWLAIPGQVAAVSQPSYEPVVPEPAPVAPENAVYEPESYSAVEPVEPLEAVQPFVEPIEEIPAPEAAVPQDELRPGDIIVEPTVSIPDTQLERPEITATSPNEAVSIIRPPVRQESQPTNWLLWGGGGVAALLLALLAFGGRLRDRFGSTPIAPAQPRPKPAASEPVQETAQEPVIGDIDIDISDDSPTAENPALDADLIMGTGLSESSDVDVASDFAFAATTDLDLDLELTKEMAEDTDQPETDIIPPPSADESSILKSEVLPEEEDDDYDMSVIVDATKMPDPTDVTERDLAAIAVEDDDETVNTGDYTVSQEVDYKVLEKDYEDEMTATQMLNAEIQKASEEIAANDDTGINPTVSMEAEDDTVEMPPKSGKKAS